MKPNLTAQIPRDELTCDLPLALTITTTKRPSSAARARATEGGAGSTIFGRWSSTRSGSTLTRERRQIESRRLYETFSAHMSEAY